MESLQTVGAAEFKATCLDLLDRVGARELDQVVITKRGRPVARLVPIPTTAEEVAGLHGCLRGSVVIPADIDIAAPVFEGEIAAETGDWPA